MGPQDKKNFKNTEKGSVNKLFRNGNNRSRKARVYIKGSISPELAAKDPGNGV